MRDITRNVMLFASLALWGCTGASGPDTSGVSGVVKLDGAPLANATVLFVPENGRPAGGETNDQGEYTLEFKPGQPGAIPGKNLVRISTARAASQDSEGNDIAAAPERVPKKYNVNTELSFTVEDGKANTANFDLTSDGGVIVDTAADDSGD